MILAIDPGSTSTKVALYEGGTLLCQESLAHSADELAAYERIVDQRGMRIAAVRAFMARHDIRPCNLEAIMSRGGLLHPLAAGVYAINDSMLHDSGEGAVHQHASNLGALIAYDLAREAGIPCYIADPVSVDEFDDVARISGLKDLPRRSLVHALNIRKVAFNTARAHGKRAEDMNMIVAHLGGGISIAPLCRGRIIDVNNANEGGPYSPERTGGMPAAGVVAMCFAEGADERSIADRLTRKGGLVSYLGTNDARDVQRRIEAGDSDAALVFEGMAYQVAKEIGAMATVLHGRVDVIVITGGLANNEMLVHWIEDRIGFIAPVEVVPGENELEALNDAYMRLKQGIEAVKTYE